MFDNLRFKKARWSDEAGGMLTARRDRRRTTAAVAGVLTLTLLVDPFSLGSVGPALADGGPGLQSRSDNFNDVISSLGLDPAVAAEEMTASWGALPDSGGISALPAEAPVEDEEVVVLSEGEGTVPAVLGQPATSPEPPAPVALELGGMDVVVAASGTETSPEAVRLRVAGDAETAAAGVTGVLLGVSDASESPVVTDPHVDLTVSYETFAGLGGGDWASRLRFVWLPDCTTSVDCRPMPIETVNDPLTQTVSARVPVSPGESEGTSPAGVFTTLTGSTGGGSLAIMAGSAGATGNWAATDLAPSSTWGNSGSTGGFSWSLPIPVPPVAAGPSPELALSYSSAASDGRVPSTNNQAGWIGEGFDLTRGYIERSYVPCLQDESGSANNIDHPSGDLCWGAENATMVFNGSAVELIRDGSSNIWHSKFDDGSRVEHITGSSWNAGEADEYWKVTTTDGTQYYFGRGKRSASDTALNSAWTVPVYGNHSGERCYKTAANGGFEDSRCTQVWRWNLEYVVDASGNSMTYFYTTETNRYVYNIWDNVAGDTTSYVSGGRLDRIEYGTRAGQESSGSAPAKVTFTSTPRCITEISEADSFCSSSQTSTDSHEWLDTPTDLICTGATGELCTGISPVFFDRYKLSTITTSTYDGSAYQPVDSWTLGQTFDPEGTGIGLEEATNPVLVLRSVTRTGRGGTATETDDLTLPPVVFSYTFLANRVGSVDDSQPPLLRPRITAVRTDSGASVSVNYRTECAPGDVPGTGESAQEANTRLCYPVKWYPDDGSQSLTEYFHKYVVDTMVESGAAPVSGGSELITGSLPKLTSYDYGGGAAWAKPTGAMVKEREMTFSEFRGFASVTTTVGLGGESSSTRSEYFRGMGDELTAGPTGYTVTATDRVRYQGQVFAAVELNGSTKISETVTVPGEPVEVATNAKGATATRIPSSTAYGFSYGAAGALVHRTKTLSSYDENSQVTSIDDLGDLTTTDDDRCTTISYAHENDTNLAAKHLVGLAAETETVSTACGETVVLPDDLISSDVASYDASGRILASERLDPTDGVGHVSVSEVLDYDDRGRPLSVSDAAGQISTVTYQQSTGGLLQSMTSTTPDPDGAGPESGLSTTTVFNPLTGMVSSTVDANGRATSGTYDALGRLLTVRYPQHVGLTQPSIAYEYRVDENGLNSILTKTLGADGQTQHVSVALYDGLLRPFQYQLDGLDAGADHDADAATRGRMVSHLYYDSAGRVAKQTGQWWAQGAPEPTPIVPIAVPPSQTTFDYDGAGRVVAEIFWVGNDSDPANEKWRTTTSYDGATTLQIPPLGGTPQAVVADALGRTIELRQYLRDPDDDAAADTPAEVLALGHQSTTYAFDTAGRLEEMRDPSNNLWSYTYDWGGRQVSATDPDGGTTTTTYDLLNRVVTRTNGNGQTLAYTYDGLGRTTSLRDNSPTGTVRAQWEYDQALDPDGDPVLGLVSAATRFVGGQAYTTSIPSYDEAYRPLATTVTLPASPEYTDALDSTSFTTEYSYTADGQVTSISLPAVVSATGAKKLGAETVTTRYDSASMPSWMSGGFGWGAYVAESRFGADGRAIAADLGNTYGAVVTYGYEDGTNRLQGIALDRQGHDTDLDLEYGYDNAGNVTSLKDQASTSAGLQDNQCFGYDGLRRLEVAWTAGDGDCSIAQSAIQVSDVGGVAPYWTEYGYDPLGNRTSLTEHALGTSTDAVTTYTHGVGGVGPHQVASTTQSVGGVQVAAASYGYDNAGNRTSKLSDSVATAYEWDAEGELVGVGDDEYVYDASGNRLVRSEASGMTIYLPGGQEIHIDGTTVSATRYYTFAGVSVAVRTGSGLGGVTSLVCDRQGTVLAAVPNTVWTASSVQRVYTDPFGAIRQGSDTGVPGDHRFLGAVRDAGSGLTLLGARYFDTSLGQFISVDPVLDAGLPAQFNAYVYSGNNPVTWSDPSGLGWDLWGGLVSAAKTAWNATTAFVNKYQAEIIGGIAGVAVTVGCLAITAGVGSIACAVAGGAVAGAVTSLWKTQVTKTEKFSWGGLAASTGMGAISGFVGGAAGPVLGNVLRSVASAGAGAATVSAVRAGVQSVLSKTAGVVSTIGQRVSNGVKSVFAGGSKSASGSAASVGTRTGLPRDALGRFTSGAGGESAATAAGRSAHANYANTLGGGNYVFNRALPGSRLRPDAVDYSQNIVRELKPGTSSGISQGWRQVNKYKTYLEELTGQPWTAYVDVYTP